MCYNDNYHTNRHDFENFNNFQIGYNDMFKSHRGSECKLMMVFVRIVLSPKFLMTCCTTTGPEPW